MADPTTYNPSLFRDQIAVDQPQGGANYPFVGKPSHNLDLLIADLYLSYRSDVCEIDAPLSIKWLDGFGPVVVDSPAAGPNAQDVLIVDANDATVFDSRTATSFTSTTWGDYTILEWLNDDYEVLRIVRFDVWPEEIAVADQPVWLNYFEPDPSVLDPRSYEATPRKVWDFSIITTADNNPVSDLVFDSGTGLILREGYNIGLESGDPSLEDGEAAVHNLTITAATGAGLGDVPCVYDGTLRRINGVETNDRGDISLIASGCYRTERPLSDSDWVAADDLFRIVETGTIVDIPNIVGATAHETTAAVLYVLHQDTVAAVTEVTEAGAELNVMDIYVGAVPLPVTNASAIHADASYIWLLSARRSAGLIGYVMRAQRTATDRITVERIISFPLVSNHGIEGFFVDPISNDGYLFSREELSVVGHDAETTHVTKIDSADLLAVGASGSTTPTVVTTITGISNGGVTDADISFDGRRIIIRDTADGNVDNATYAHKALMWERDTDTQTVDEVLAAAPIISIMPEVVDEPDGRAIAFKRTQPYEYYTTGQGNPVPVSLATHVTGSRMVTVEDAALQISNDCSPCCECQDFANVYEAIRKLSLAYYDLAKRAEAVRDQYAANKERWESSAECRARGSIRVIGQAMGFCKVAIAAGFCNTTDEPITDLELRFCFDPTGPAGCIVCDSATRQHGPNVQHTEPYKLSGSWPRFSAVFECISPGQTARITFVVHFPGCVNGQTMSLTVSAHGNKTAEATPQTLNVSLLAAPDDDCCETSLGDDLPLTTDPLCG